MDARRLDGNAAAGILQEVFGADVTAARGTCSGCGAVEALGAVHLYLAAGMVLRCPHCDTMLVRVVVGRGRAWVDLGGLRSLELAL